MSVGAVEAIPRSVLDVLGRLRVALSDVEQVLVLGPGGVVVGSAGSAPVEATNLARALATTLAGAASVGARESARCVVTLAHHCVFVYVLGEDLTVALLGPANWNVALTSRLVEPVLVRFVDAYLPERELAVAASNGAPAPGEALASLPVRRGAGEPGPVVREQDRPTLEGSEEPIDVALLDRLVKGLADL